MHTHLHVIFIYTEILWANVLKKKTYLWFFDGICDLIHSFYYVYVWFGLVGFIFILACDGSYKFIVVFICLFHINSARCEETIRKIHTLQQRFLTNHVIEPLLQADRLILINTIIVHITYLMIRQIFNVGSFALHVYSIFSIILPDQQLRIQNFFCGRDIFSNEKIIKYLNKNRIG